LSWVLIVGFGGGGRRAASAAGFDGWLGFVFGGGGS
jgi:hypothetical protein